MRCHTPNTTTLSLTALAFSSCWLHHIPWWGWMCFSCGYHLVTRHTHRLLARRVTCPLVWILLPRNHDDATHLTESFTVNVITKRHSKYPLHCLLLNPFLLQCSYGQIFQVIFQILPKFIALSVTTRTFSPSFSDYVSHLYVTVCNSKGASQIYFPCQIYFFTYITLVRYFKDLDNAAEYAISSSSTCHLWLEVVALIHSLAQV